jgi:hypothetical protein
MSQLAFCRAVFWAFLVALGVSIWTDPFWLVVMQAACIGFWDWEVERVKKNLQS